MEEILFKCEDFEWVGKNKINYKTSNVTSLDSFLDVTRQNLYSGNEEAGFDLRYFECECHGHTTLEKHNHVHVVVVMRGEGAVIVGGDIYKVKPFDMIRIPSWSAHQLINLGDEPFGFLCTVDHERDAYQLLTSDEVANLKKNNEVKKVIHIPDSYFKSY